MSHYAEGRALLAQEKTADAQMLFAKGFAAGEVKCAYGLFLCALTAGTNVPCALEMLAGNLPKIREIAPFDAESAFIIGRCYEMGCAVKPDEEEAIRFYEMASDAGSADAAFNLGCLYANKNEKEAAVRCFRKFKKTGRHDADDYLKKLEG